MFKDTRLFLVRHLPTDYNESGFIMGRERDLFPIESNELDTRFKKRMIHLSRMYDLSRKNVVIVTSPLKRARITATLVKEALNTKGRIKPDNHFTETDMGEFEDQKASTLREKYGEMIDQWMFEPESFRFPNGESYLEVSSRVDEGLLGLKELLKKDKNVVLCTHVDIVKMLITKTLGASFNVRRNFSIPNGSISVLKLENENLSVEGVNIFPLSLKSV